MSFMAAQQNEVSLCCSTNRLDDKMLSLLKSLKHKNISGRAKPLSSCCRRARYTDKADNKRMRLKEINQNFS